MTIKYLDSKRLSGSETTSTATISDDFSSNNFTDVGSGVGVNTTNQTLGGTFVRGSIIKSYDPITALSDTAWVMRFKFNLTSHSGSPTGVYIGVTDTSNATDTTNTNRDAIMFWTYSDGGVKYAISHPTDTVFGLSYTDMTTTPSNGDVYYVELKRTSDTTGTCSLYNDSGFSDLEEAKNFTIPSGASNTGLDNILITNLSDGNGGGTTVATIEDLKIYDGVTSVVSRDTKPTNVQDNSIYIETDTAFRYWFNPSTLNVDYSSGWTQEGTQITTGSDQVTFSSAACGTDRRVYKALGFTLDDTFTVEWEFSLTDSGSSQGQPFALTAGTSQLDNSTTNQDSIYFKSSSAGYQLACKDGTTNTQDSSTHSYTNGTTLYARLVRDGTSGTLSVYSDASRSTLVNSSTHTIPATVTGLNTLQHGVDAVQSGTRTLTGSISNVRVFNGSTIGTNWVKMAEPFYGLYQSDFADNNNTGWTMTSSISVTGNEMYANGINANQQYYAYYDLGVLSDTKWYVEVDFKFTNSGGGEAMIVGLSSATPLIWQNGGADALAINISGVGGIGGRVRYNTGDDHFTSGGTISNNGTWGYVVFERYDSNTMKTHIYPTDTDRKLKTNGTTYTGTITGSNITNLRYLQVGGWYVGHSASRVVYGHWDNIKVYNGVNW